MQAAKVAHHAGGRSVHGNAVGRRHDAQPRMAARLDRRIDHRAVVQVEPARRRRRQQAQAAERHNVVAARGRAHAPPIARNGRLRVDKRAPVACNRGARRLRLQESLRGRRWAGAHSRVLLYVWCVPMCDADLEIAVHWRPTPGRAVVHVSSKRRRQVDHHAAAADRCVQPRTVVRPHRRKHRLRGEQCDGRNKGREATGRAGKQVRCLDVPRLIYECQWGAIIDV